MPVNRHLVWNEIRDFRAGLWTKGDTWLMPPTAAQEMQDCYPVEGVGLRAFYRRQDYANIGINMLTYNQATLENGNTTGWEADVNTTLAAVTTQAAEGGYSLRLTATAGATMSARTPAGLSGRAVSPSTQYTALASFRANTTARSCQVLIRWYDDTGALISTSTGSTGADSNAAWTQVPVITATSPANAAFAAVVVQVVSAAAAEIHFVDKVSLAPGALTVYDYPGDGLNHADELYFGLFAHPSGGINPVSERYLMAWNSITRLPKLYYSQGGQWAVIKQFVATSATPTIKQSFFTTYLSGTTRKVAFNLNASSTDDGIWIGTGGAAPTKMTVTGSTAASGPITVHQARLVVTDGSAVRFTDVNTETFQSTNVVNVEPSGLRPATIVMVSYEPSDLLIGKESGPFILIQGDLTDPTVRALDDSISLVAGHKPAKTPSGLAVTAHRDGEFFTSPGGGTNRASDSLSHNNFSLPAVFGSYTPSWIGDSYYAEGFLFTPAAVLHLETGAWFTVLNPPGNFLAALFAYDRGTVS